MPGKGDAEVSGTIGRIITRMVLTTAVFAAPGCNSAHTESIAEPNQTIISTHKEIIQLKRRPDYFSGEVRRQYLIRQASEMMRKDAPESTRVFYRSPEEKNMSFSIGDTRDGYLINGQPLPAPSLLLRQLPVQYERGIAYGTPNLITILVDTARTMQKKYPGTIMYLGNMGLREGGDIPYSVSHNSGRDADIAFYLKDENGKFANPRNMYKMSAHLQARSPDGVYTFDLEKNTTLVETLLTHPKIHVQFIFLAKHLRTAIQRELVRREASEELLARFEETVQVQAAHNDHLHIRIYCSNEDICAGCIDKSIIHEWQEDPLPKRDKCIAKHAATLGSKKSTPIQMASALQRLSLLGAAGEHKSKVLKLIAHEDADVRNAALIAAQTLDSSVVPALAARFDAETDPVVRQTLFETLARFDCAETRAAFDTQLQSDNLAPQNLETLLRYIAHHPHQDHLEPLIGMLRRNIQRLPADNQPVIDTISTVANRVFCTTTLQDSCLAEIESWYSSHAELPRNQWLIEGFKAAGYRVIGLMNSDIPVLLDAIDGPRPVSINAQLVLKKLGKLDKDSLDWSAADAKWHYTKHFKRHSKKYKIDLSDRDEKGNKIAKEKPKTKRK